MGSLSAESEIVITLNDKPVARLTSIGNEETHKPGRFVVSTNAELEEKLLAGVRQLDQGEGISGDAALKELRVRANARRPA